MAQVAIIIVNWNTGKLLASCIRSVLALPEQDLLHRVIVIDNASTDKSVDYAEQSAGGSDKVSFVRSGENLGFSMANNIGIRRLGKDFNGHVLLLNPDTDMKPGSLAGLVAALGRNPKTGIVGPRLLNPDGSLQHSVRRFPTFTTLAGMFLKLHHVFPRDPVWRHYIAADMDYGREQIVDQVMGACFLIHRDALRDIGLLDERFWVWFEEVDYCQRAAKHGWNVLYTPSCEVIHHGGASFHQLVGWRKAKPFIVSTLAYAAKHFPLMQAMALAAFVPVAVALALPASLAHAAQKQKNVTRL